jgi:hypothetical protein
MKTLTGLPEATDSKPRKNPSRVIQVVKRQERGIAMK